MLKFINRVFKFFVFGYVLTSSVWAGQSNGEIIDLMVMYTDAALQVAGGEEEIEYKINFAVLNTNTIYRNSGIYQRLRLVHSGKVDFGESVFTLTDDVMEAMEAKDDGHLDEIHDLRDEHGADLVMLLVNGNGWSDWSGGQATVLYNNDISLKEHAAFSLVDVEFLYSGTAFPHELGHNMGLKHDWYVDGGETAPYSYAYAHVNTDYGWRTIMAYEDQCLERGVECPRILFFSNPDLLYNGEPLGVAPGTDTSCKAWDLSHTQCDSDARRVLNNTAATVAAFRDSKMDDDFGIIDQYSPVDLINTYIPTFSWEAASGAEKYRLYIATAWDKGTKEGLSDTLGRSFDGSSVIHDNWYDADDICTDTRCSVEVAFHFANGNHYWSVQAYKNDSYGLWMDPTDFILFKPTEDSDTAISPYVTPLSPSEVTVGSNPTFNWKPALGNTYGTPDPTHYRILVWSRDSSETVYWTEWYDADEVCNSASCSATPQDHSLQNGRYLWRIKSKSAYGEGEYDTRLYFDVDSSIDPSDSSVCGVTSNHLLFDGENYILTVPNFCISGNSYSGITKIRLALNGDWSLEATENPWETAYGCSENIENRVIFNDSYLILSIPGYCSNDIYMDVPISLILNFGGTWGI